MTLRRLFLSLALLLSVAVAAQEVDIDKLWDYDQPALSEARFREAIEQAGQRADATRKGEAITQLARALGLQEKFDAANLVLDELQADLPNLPAVVSVRYMLERGRLINGRGEPKRAGRWFRNALTLAQKHDLDFLAIDAAHMLAIAETGKASLDWNFKALAMAEQSKNPRAKEWFGSLYNNIGWTYHDLKDYPQALDFLRRAMAWHEARQTGKQLLIARWSVAKLLRLSGENENALRMLFDLESAWARLKEEDGYVYEEIAENLRELGRNKEARPYFARAYHLLSKDAWLMRQEPGRVTRLKQLSS